MTTSHPPNYEKTNKLSNYRCTEIGTIWLQLNHTQYLLPKVYQSQALMVCSILYKYFHCVEKSCNKLVLVKILQIIEMFHVFILPLIDPSQLYSPLINMNYCKFRISGKKVNMISKLKTGLQTSQLQKRSLQYMSNQRAKNVL